VNKVRARPIVRARLEELSKKDRLYIYAPNYPYTLNLTSTGSAVRLCKPGHGVRQ
jgi:hypothetical protein